MDHISDNLYDVLIMEFSCVFGIGMNSDGIIMKYAFTWNGFWQ